MIEFGSAGASPSRDWSTFMLLLTIESTCDETAAAVITTGWSPLVGRRLAGEAAPRFGGVVPEIASRAHVERILPVIDETLPQSGRQARRSRRVAVANTPGLAGSLLVGLTAAKTLCLACDLPLMAINHSAGPHLRLPRGGGANVFPCIGLSSAAGIRTSIAANRRSISRRSAARSTTPPARRSTKSRACSASPIPADRRSNGRRAKAIQDVPLAAATAR